jgi:hypothetical protein
MKWHLRRARLRYFVARLDTGRLAIVGMFVLLRILEEAL